MTVKKAFEKEINVLREKHMSLVKRARDRNDHLYGMATLNTYELLIDSYSRVIKELEE